MPFLTPIFTAVSTWFGGLSIGMQIAVKLGGSLLLSAASKALMPDPSVGLSARTVTVREPVSPAEIVYGSVRKGGVIIYMDVAGPNEGRLDLIIVLAAHKVKHIGAVYFDGVRAIDDGATDGNGRWAGKVGIDRWLGESTGQAFAGFANTDSKWGPNDLLLGCAAIRLALFRDQNAYPNGIPNITVDIEGKDDIYDPRLGTRSYSTNPALCVADYLSMADFGLGAPIGAANGVNDTRLAASANICDEIVVSVGEGNEKRYSCNGVVSLDQTPKAIIEGLLTAMAGSAYWHSGQWHIHAGAYEAPLLTLTDDDVDGDGFRLITRVSRSENFNAVRGQFVSRKNDWQPDDFPAYKSDVYLAEDNGERSWRDIALPFTTSPSVAQRLAKIELERARRQMTIELTGKLSAWRIVAGDTVLVTYARWGFSAKPFEVRSSTLELAQDAQGNPVLRPVLVLRETSPLVFDWSSSEEQIYDAAPVSTLPNPFLIDPPSGMAVSEALYQTRVGGGIKAEVTVSWSASASAFVREYQVEGKLTSDTVWTVFGRTTDTSLAVPDFQPGLWDFRVKAINQSNVESDYDTIVDQQIDGLAAPPADVTGLSLQAAGGVALLKWAQHPDLDVRVGGTIQIRHSIATVPTWLNSVSMDAVPGDAALAAVPLKPGTYLLKAFDSSGQSSPNAAAIGADGYQAITFAALATLTEDTTFTGVKTNCVVVASALQIDTGGDVDAVANFDTVTNVDTQGGVLPTGTYDFASAMNFGLVKLVRLRSVIDIAVNDLTDNIDLRPGTVDSWINVDGAGGGEVDAHVEVRTTTDNPAGTPVWSDWSRVDSREVRAWGVQARAQLSTADAEFSPALSQLRLLAEEVA